MKSVHLTLCCIIVLFHTACAQQDTTGNKEVISQPYSILSEAELQQLNEQKLQNAKKMSASSVEYFVTYAANNKFGYNIFIDGQLYIEQTTIPAKEGIAGFNTKEDAEIIARLAIKKLEAGEIPPTITVQELKEHGIE